MGKSTYEPRTLGIGVKPETGTPLFTSVLEEIRSKPGRGVTLVVRAETGNLQAGHYVRLKTSSGRLVEYPVLGAINQEPPDQMTIFIGLLPMDPDFPLGQPVDGFATKTLRLEGSFVDPPKGIVDALVRLLRKMS